MYFAIIALCQIYDFIFSRFEVLGLPQRPAIGKTAGILFLGASIFAFTLYAPLVYGNEWTQAECKRVKLFETWDWDCNTFHTSYDQYKLHVPSVDTSIPVSSAAPVVPPVEEANVTPNKAAPVNVGEGRVIHREEKVEYHDEHGNVLNEEQVNKLRGKVSFQTRYETRTRIIDAAGNELYEGPAESVPVHLLNQAPPHPDVEGRNPETKGKGAAGEGEGSGKPATNEAVVDGDEKEKSAQAEGKKPKPASEQGAEATKKEL